MNSPNKRFSNVLVAMATVMLVHAWAAVSAHALPGDVNGDGILDNADITLVENHITGKALLNSADQVKADINQNGQVDVGDVIAIAKLRLNTVKIVPNVIQEGQGRAEFLLNEAGLTKGQIIPLKSDSYLGIVIGQVPQPGLVVSPETPVDLYVSAGPSGGAYLEISPTEVDLGTSGKTATFQVKCRNGNVRWTTGMWADYVASPASGTGDATVTLTLDRTRLPFGKMSLVFAVVPDISSSESGAYASINLEQTVYPPPTLDAIMSWTPFSTGDLISIDGNYFAQNAANNILSVNGKEVTASYVGFSPPNVKFVVPSDLPPGMIEIKARRKADAILGSSPWSVVPKVTRLVAPTQITLAPGVDGNSLWVEPSWQTYDGDISGDYAARERSAGASDWILGGTNLTKVNGAFVNEAENQPRIGGSGEKELIVEARVDGQTFYLPARALNDTQVVAMPQKMYKDKALFFSRLTPGKKLQARLWGSEIGTFFPRVSNWTELAVAANPPAIGSVARMSANSLTIAGIYETLQPNTVVQIAKGTTLIIERDVYNNMMLRAPGLWAGDIRFLGQSDYMNAGYFARRIALKTPGTYTIQNLTNGNTRIIEVVEGGAPNGGSDGKVRLAGSISNMIMPPNKAVTLWVNGAQATIPAGALATVANKHNLASFSYTQLFEGSYTLSDPEADDGKIRTDLFFRRANISSTLAPADWEPSSIMQPITIKQYYTDQMAINGAPSLAAMDSESGIYWELPCTVDTGKKLITLVLPAGTYSRPSSQTGLNAENNAIHSAPRTAPPAGFPSASFYEITRKIGIPYLKSARSIMTDAEKRFAVDYISDSSSSSYVSDEYAEGIMDTLLATYANFKKRGWRLPEDTTYIYLRKTLFGGYGSTTKGVFGRPTVTINIAECPKGSAPYYTTPSHEVGHVFQRNYTTNIVAKWFDEASAEWIAVDTVGADHFPLDNLNDALPFIETLPFGFTFGYSTAEGYAAAPWPVWLSNKNGECIRKVYEALDSDPLAWENHRGVVAEACGKTIQRLYRDFARDYWLQNFAPMEMIDLNTLLYANGKTVALTMNDAGDITFTDSRPGLSSIRYSVQPNQACLDKFAGREAVIRFRCNSEDLLSDVYVYGDRASSTSIPSQPVELATFYAPTSGSCVVNNLASHKSYRFIIANGTAGRTFTPTLRIVFPTISGLSPTSGKKTGGYTVTLTGRGFGTATGSISISGSPVSISSWNDTTIKFIMPNVGDNTASWNIVVRTEENVATNGKIFTFTD